MNKLNGMVEERNAIGAKVPHKVKVMVPLMSLPNSYKLLVTSYEIYRSTRLTWEVVIIRLLNEELMRRENGDNFSASDIALVHTSHKSVGSKKIARNKLQDICNYCKKKGHWVRNCTKIKVDEKSKFFDKKVNIKKTKHGNNVIDHNEAFVVITLSMFSDDAWYMDSSASIHLFHRKDWLYEFEKTSLVNMGDNSTQEAIGKRKIKMRLIVGGNTIYATLNDAIYVPSLIKNLYSVSNTTFQGYNVKFGDDNCEVGNNQKRMVMRGIKKN